MLGKNISFLQQELQSKVLETISKQNQLKKLENLNNVLQHEHKILSKQVAHTSQYD